MRHEATLARRADAAYRRQKAALLKDGWSTQEAEEMLSNYDVNPASRLMLALRHLGLGGVTRNPKLGAATDPAALSESAEFHGEDGSRRSTARLSASERRGLPEDVVVVGKLESLSYKPLGGSGRANAVWVHEAGDKGLLRTPGKGRSLLVADPKTGKVDIVGGPMRFRSSVGLWD